MLLQDTKQQLNNMCCQSYIKANAPDLGGVHSQGLQQCPALAAQLSSGISEAGKGDAAAHVVAVPMPHELGGVRGICLAPLQLQADCAALHSSSCSVYHQDISTIVLAVAQ